MDYLQYNGWNDLAAFNKVGVLNLIINGLPSIHKNGNKTKRKIM